MNLGRPNATSDLCVGGIFDLTSGSTIEAGGGNPSWVVGDTFLVRSTDSYQIPPLTITYRKMCTLSSGLILPLLDSLSFLALLGDLLVRSDHLTFRPAPHI